MPGKLKPVLILLLSLPALLLLADFLFPFNPHIDYATQLTDRKGETIHAFLNNEDKWRLHSNASEITPLLRKTLIYKEDQYFYWHPGINPGAILRAAFGNVLMGRRTSGASTITMQVVRMLERRPRTYWNKIVEMGKALQLEMHYSKEEIFEMYVNLVPYGGNIEGVKAASILYFGKPPQLLSLAEIAALTIIPNRPSSLRPGGNNDALLTARNHWLERFEREGVFDNETVRNALSEPLSIKRRRMPSQAPHLAIRLKSQSKESPLIRTTINIQLQNQIEEQVRNFINRRQLMGIHNASVLVINNETMEAEAYVGSADFGNVFDGGQVDGIRAVRSPGSTLKPLLYALAFDKGNITPKTILNDVPSNFSGYEPENFDRHFNGAVTTEFALAHSLNIPAVKVLKDIGTPELVKKLKTSGFKAIEKQSSQLGLSMILGGCGVTLEELTRLFAAFANGGDLRDIHYIKNQKKGTAKNIISQEAGFLITHILTQITRPDLPTNFDNTYHLPRIAWKTGTSYGKRDAWSIGYNKRFTVGVWVGNFSGAGVPELSGANTATPLLFSIFNALDYNSPKGWYDRPDGIDTRQVCATSGDIPSEFCEHEVPDQYIVGVSAYKKCQHMRWVFTNASGKMSYCTHCLPENGFEKRMFPQMSPELIAFYEIQKIPYQKTPPHNPACDRVFYYGAPIIVSPNEGSEYFVGKNEQQKIQLMCQTGNDVQEVFWYVNDALKQKAPPGEGVFMNLPAGRVKISCVDDKGRASNIWIIVRQI